MAEQRVGIFRGNLDKKRASRLLRRATGAVRLADRDRLAGLEIDQAIARLREGTEAGPRWHEIQTLEVLAASQGSLPAYRTWQVARLVESPQPFCEMMTLFWLDLFAVSALRVGSLFLYHDFVNGVRTRVFGPLEDLFSFALGHPAFLLNLRAVSNYRSQPQAQIGRFLVRKFLGEDPERRKELVRDIARAYTGTFVTSGRLRVLSYEHDPGPKTIGDQTGDLWPVDVAKALARDVAAVRTVIRRLFDWFVSSEIAPPPGMLEAAEAILAAGKSVSDVVPVILGWEACLRDEEYRRVKSPLEVYLAVARPFGFRATTYVAETLAELGWDVVHPPTLAGWPRGRAWLTGVQNARHSALVKGLLSGEEKWGTSSDLLPLLSRNDWSETLVDILLDDQLPPELAPHWEKIVAEAKNTAARKEAMVFLASLPHFHLS